MYSSICLASNFPVAPRRHPRPSQRIELAEITCHTPRTQVGWVLELEEIGFYEKFHVG
jgi:hypothetical protein